MVHLNRNGGRMCAWARLILILTGTWVCGAHSTVQSCGVYGKKVGPAFCIGVPTATRRPPLPVQRYDIATWSLTRLYLPFLPPLFISGVSRQIKFRRGLPPGDGVLFYPGEVFSSSHEPVASLRLERLLSGLQVSIFSLFTLMLLNLRVRLVHWT